MPSKITVIGSSNTDMVIKTHTLPLPGQTVLGGSFFMNAGGKGANQAVAAARLNGNVTFIAKVGNDVFGKNATESFEKENINTKYVFTDDANASGVALITVDANGENCIAVASGANATVSIADINKAKAAIEEADVILVQLEIPLPTVEYVVTLAAQYNKTIILNPAPAAALSDNAYTKLSFFTPNEIEAQLLSGIAVLDASSAKEAAHYFINKGVKNVIITMGKEGVFWCDKNKCKIVPSPLVNAMDTTAAGDVFNGALAVALAEGKEIKEAITFANYSAALSVTKLGAQASAPHRDQVEMFLQSSPQS